MCILENVCIYGFNINSDIYITFPNTTINSYILVTIICSRVHIFWEGHKVLQNLHQLFDWQYIRQRIGGDFAKFCGLIRWTLKIKYLLEYFKKDENILILLMMQR